VALNKGVAPAGTPTPTSDAIASMVAGLAARLDTQGGSIEEWTQLVRAYMVLGDDAQAKQAMAEARSVLPADGLGRFNDGLKDMGVKDAP
jgi:cytochrome c-type biogenesis protein CcmH